MTRAELNQQFLEAIVPAEGNLVIGNSKKSLGDWFDYTDQVRREQSIARNHNRDLYYSPASYTGGRRVKTEALHCRVVFLDIDAGDVKKAKHGDKVYDNWKDALRDIDDWVKWTAESGHPIPAPSWVIKSGEGLHLYWVTREDMDTAMWEGLEAGLIRKASDDEVKVDTAVGSMNEWLRLPGGTHQASGHLVEVLEQYSTKAVYSYLDLCRAFPPVASAKAASLPGLGARPEHLNAQPPPDANWTPTFHDKSFRDLLTKSLNGEGCAFLAKGYKDQKTLAEELWRAMLSIAINCNDGDEMIHEVSNKYAGYSATETVKKAAYVKDKPYSCQRIDLLCPGVCPSCAHYGNIKSPIVLGVVQHVDVVTPDEHRERVLKTRIASIPEAKTAHASALRRINARVLELETLAPVMPDEYAISKGSKLIKHGSDGDQIIFDRPTYFIERLRSDSLGDTLLLIYESPCDGLRELTMKQALLANSGDLMKWVTGIGIVMVSEWQQKEILMFLRKSAHELQQRKARALRQSFGWQDGTQSFVHGRHEFMSSGEMHLTSVTSGDAFLNAMLPGDDADPKTWGAMAQHFMEPGFEPGMFAIGLSLGAPLFKLGDMQGGLVHLYSSASARGKTSVMQLALAVWGRSGISPGGGSGLMSTRDDTVLSTYTRLATLGTIPVGIDELTNLETKELVSMAYNITQGRQRDRLDGKTNSLRENNGSWQMAVMSTGNTSIADALKGAGDMMDATRARLIELNCERIPVLDIPNHELATLFADIQRTHSGIVGRMVAYYVTKERQTILKILETIQTDSLSRLRFQPRDRYWRGMMVCAYAGLIIGQSMGLFKFNAIRLENYFLDLLMANRLDVQSARHTPEELLQDFLQEHLREQLVVADEKSSVPQMDIPYGVISKFVVKTQTLYVVAEKLETWVKEKHIGVESIRQYLLARGSKRDRYAILPGTSGRESRTLCWMIPNYLLSGTPQANTSTEDESIMEQMNRSTR